MPSDAPNILVLQHISIEHPGILRDFLRADGIAWHAVELDEGEDIPPLDEFDALWVMGGPMDVWEEDAHPWLVTEQAAIREAVIDRGMPYLGLCLGHQLLAAALGGEVGPATTPEIGVLEVELSAAGRASPLFDGFPETCRCLQWHSAEVRRAPDGAAILASSPACAVQAIAVGDRAFGLQYHVEITGATVPEWSEVPAYKCALEDNLGPDALAGFQAAAAANMTVFNTDARRLYDNFMSVMRTR